jgi:hypothetical protein
MIGSSSDGHLSVATLLIALSILVVLLVAVRLVLLIV